MSPDGPRLRRSGAGSSHAPGSMPTSSACSQLQRPQTLEGEDVAVGRGEAVEPGERRGLARAHVGPDDAAAFNAGISRLPNLAIERAAGRFGGLLQAGAGGVVQPAVERAAQAAVLAAAETQVGAAMRAVPVQQPVAAGRIAEQHEVLAQQAHPLHRARRVKLLDQCGRLPVTAHQRAARRAGTGLGDQPVLLGGEHPHDSVVAEV